MVIDSSFCEYNPGRVAHDFPDQAESFTSGDNGTTDQKVEVSVAYNKLNLLSINYLFLQGFHKGHVGGTGRGN